MLVAGALVVLLPGLDLVPVIVASQNLQGLLLPVVLIFMVLLANDRRLMGEHRNGRLGNVLAWSAIGLVMVEAPVPGPGRRSTDIRLDRRDEVVLMEVETHVRTLEAIIREGTAKQAAVAETDPAGQRIHIVLVLPSTRHHRALVNAHPGIVAAAFPATDAALSRALESPDVEWPGSGILWITDGHDRDRVGRTQVGRNQLTPGASAPRRAGPATPCRLSPRRSRAGSRGTPTPGLRH